MGDTVGQARRLLAEMSLPEVLLWRALRQRPDGFKFRRQHPLDQYVLDFFCREAGLAIEIDGEAHNRGDRPERDQFRTLALRNLGIVTLRIPAGDVLRDLDSALRQIVTLARDRTPLHHPALPGGPPPRRKAGED